MKTRKGEILDYIRQRPRRYKEIVGKFGANGTTNGIIYEMLHDEIIFKPSRGIYEVRPKALKSRKTK